MLRGVRGATTVEANTKEEIFEAVLQLLDALTEANGLQEEELGAVIFSSTPEVNAAFPAAAARRFGWNDVALFGAQEIEAEDGVPQCIRVLVLWNTDKAMKELRHVYLGRAVALRQDRKVEAKEQ